MITRRRSAQLGRTEHPRTMVCSLVSGLADVRLMQHPFSRCCITVLCLLLASFYAGCGCGYAASVPHKVGTQFIIVIIVIITNIVVVVIIIILTINIRRGLDSTEGYVGRSRDTLMQRNEDTSSHR